MKISRSFRSKILALSIFLVPAFLITGQNLSPKKQIENCQKTKSILDRYKKIVQEPYVIEGCASKAILCGENGEGIIPMSIIGKQKYRMYFSNAGFDGKVFVKVQTINKKLIFTNEADPSIDYFAFTPIRTEKYFVEFVYKQSANPDAVGCVSVLLATREF